MTLPTVDQPRTTRRQRLRAERRAEKERRAEAEFWAERTLTERELADVAAVAAEIAEWTRQHPDESRDGGDVIIEFPPGKLAKAVTVANELHRQLRELGVRASVGAAPEAPAGAAVPAQARAR